MSFFSHRLLNKSKRTLATGGNFSYYEYKYLVRHENLSQVYDLLNEFYGSSDPYPSGVVDSIYYDTYDEQCLGQCLNGDSDKVKFRIRGYGDGTYISQHQKIKTLSGVAKYKCRLRKITAPGERAPYWEELEPVDRNEYASGAIAYATSRMGYLFPSIRVKYQRHRFRSYDDRMTLDTNIEVFAPQNGLSRTIAHAQLGQHVLEIKTRNVRPNLPFIGLIQLQQVSFSKFMLGLELLNG